MMSQPTASYGIAPSTVRANLATTDAQSMYGGFEPDISADGRFVVFVSREPGLAPGDGDSIADVFVRDLSTGETILVSVDSAGRKVNADCGKPSISADGRFVAFITEADNLVGGDTNNCDDVFVHDRVTGKTERVSVSTSGEQGDGDSISPAISDDGRFVAFQSCARNLVEPQDSVGWHIYLHDRQSGETTVASVTPSGTRIVGNSYAPDISGDGRYVAFESYWMMGDANGANDIYVYDRLRGVTERITVNQNGEEARGHSYNAAISADGVYVAYESLAPNLVPDDTNGGLFGRDIFVYNRRTGETVRASVSSTGEETYTYASNENPAISADGRFVAFSSSASNLVEGDFNGCSDVFVHDLLSRETFRVSVSSSGEGGADWSARPAISADGRRIAFESRAGNLVAGDTNEYVDIFVNDRGTISTVLAGRDRYATSAAVSRYMYPDGADNVIVATGQSWPDALGSAALAGVVDAPVLLVGKDFLPNVVVAEIRRLRPKRIYIVGGTGVVSPTVERALRSSDDSITVQRIAGVDRYETARRVAATCMTLQGSSFEHGAFLVTGQTFPDALSVSAVSAARGWPVLLLDPRTGVDDALVQTLERFGIREVIVVGGLAAVPLQVERDLKTKVGCSVQRWAGLDRYATAAAVARGAGSMGFTWSQAGVVSGERFPDGLVAGPMFGATRSPMLLTQAHALPASTASVLAEHAHECANVCFVGGEGAVSMAVRNESLEVLRK